jgi:hypothetical protein
MLLKGSSCQIHVGALDTISVDEVSRFLKLLHLTLISLDVLGRRVNERLLLGVGHLVPFLGESFGNVHNS